MINFNKVFNLINRILYLQIYTDLNDPILKNVQDVNCRTKILCDMERKFSNISIQTKQSILNFYVDKTVQLLNFFKNEKNEHRLNEKSLILLEQLEKLLQLMKR